MTPILTRQAALKRAIAALNQSIRVSRVAMNIAHHQKDIEGMRRYRASMEQDKEAIRILQSIKDHKGYL